MEFGILGPVRPVRAGRPVAVPSPRQRTLLAALLVRPGAVVPAGVLIDTLWDDRPPRTARNSLQAHVSALRRTLAADPAYGPLRTRPLGYQLVLAPGALDAELFADAVAGALAARDAGRWDEAVTGLDRALALWRGPALADVLAPSLAGVAAGLEEDRMRAVEERGELELGLGRHAGLTAPLRRSLAEHPLRERLWAQLVLALHRSGRRADALRTYRDADRTLRREAGVEPGPALRELHRRVLADDPGLGPPERAAGAGSASGPASAPAPLPAPDLDLDPAPGPVAPFGGVSRAGGPDRAEAVAWRRRGDRLFTLGRWAEAEQCLDRSVADLQRAGDRAAEAHSRLLLAVLWWSRGRWDRATDTVLDCLPLLLAGPDPLAAGTALRTLGVVRLRLGEPVAAAEAFRDSAARLAGVDPGEAALSRIQLALAVPDGPAAVRDDLALLRRDPRRELEAHALPEVAAAARQAGDLAAAADLLLRGLRAARAVGDPLAEAVALYGLGDVHARCHRPGPAAACWDAALGTAERLGAGPWRSRVLIARAGLPAGTPSDSVTTGRRASG
jgi:DNA-binding SARP family transcriptional activator